MKPREITALLLRRVNATVWSGGAEFGVTGMLQRDVNRAFSIWHASGDTADLQRVVIAMHAYGKLTDAEYTQIMETLQGEN